MTVSELCESCGFSPLVMPEPEREVKGAYIGDLLSWVMGRAECDNAWITIMSNINVIAVASLADVACVILSEGVTLEEDIAKTASDKGINVLVSASPSYETAISISEKI